MNKQPKAAMDAASIFPGFAASQGARRATEDAAKPGASAEQAGAHMEVVAHAKRRRFSPADRRRILEEADRCTRPGEIGALMRREGVYSSSLSDWRRQREAADLAALAPQKRGPKDNPNRAEAQRVAKLTLENERLKSRLDKALLVIEVQKKLAALLGYTLDDNGERT